MRRLKIDGIDWSDLAELPQDQLQALGIQPSKKGFLGRFVENYLAKRVALRRLFNLDRTVYIEPQFDYGLGDTTASSYSWYNAQLAFERDRRQVYRLVEEMDTFDLVSSALDLYAEEATQQDLETGLSVWVESRSAKVAELCHQMFKDIQLEDKIFGIARTIAKYGDDFEEVVLDRDKGVVALNYVYPGKLTRVEDDTGRLLGFAAGIITDSDLANLEFRKKLTLSRPYDFINFRLLSSRREFKHGESLLMSARYSWRQLKIMEDSLVVYRLNRAPDRLVHYIDVTGMGPAQAERTIEEYRSRVRKKLHIDSATGQVRQEYNPFSVLDDLFVPATKESAFKIEKLAGSSNFDELTDVEHFRQKLFGSLRVPAAFLGFEGDIDSKTGLSQQDIRFARTIKRLRRAIVSGLTTLCQIHLIYNGIDVRDPTNNFTVRMAPIALLEEMQRREIMQMRLEMVEAMIGLLGTLGLEGPDAFAWVAYVLVAYLGLTEKEVIHYFGAMTKKPPTGGTSGVSLGSSPLASSGSSELGGEEGGGIGDLFSGESPGGEAGTTPEITPPTSSGGSGGGGGGEGGGGPQAAEAQQILHATKQLLQRIQERTARKTAPEENVTGDIPDTLDKIESDTLFDLSTELEALQHNVLEGVVDANGNCANCGSAIKMAQILDEDSEDTRPLGKIILCKECGSVARIEEPYLSEPDKLGRRR